jgi:uncharacterized protein
MTAPSAPAKTDPLFAPATPETRLINLDILRGFALFGVLLVNMLMFAYLAPLYPPLSAPGLGAAGRTAEWLIRTFAEGSFYPQFAFLFGLGFALQLRKGEGVVPTYRRRLLVLLGIGVVHAVFVWLGDILVTYALVGFLLIPFRNRSDRTLLFWVVGATLYTLVTFYVLTLFGGNTLPPELLAQLERLYRTGSYFELTLVRLSWLFLNLINLLALFPQILALFLLGLLVGRRGVLQDPEAHAALLRRTFQVSLGIGLPLVLLHGAAVARGASTPLLDALDVTIGSPALGFAYLSGLALLLRATRWQARLRPLAAVGRTALSNYLAQSLVCTLIFYPYGLGLFGRVGPAWGIALTVALFAAQIVLSHLWLQRYRYGLAEWVWRALTYRTRPALRQEA